MTFFFKKLLTLLAFSVIIVSAKESQPMASCVDLAICYEQCTEEGDDICMDQCDAIYTCPEDSESSEIEETSKDEETSELF